MTLFNQISELCRIESVHVLEKEIAANNRLIESKLTDAERLRKENDRLILAVERMTTKQEHKIKELCEES